MSRNNSVTRIAATRNHTEPMFGSAVGCKLLHDKVWLWGDDNMLPNVLSLMARRSVTHRRIINDKADYIAGKGIAFSESIPLLGDIVGRANGSGETLRRVIARLALDEAMFGNAFLEIVTDEKEATGTMVQYDSLRVEYPKTADNIFSTLLTAKYPAKTESKLVNEYQSAELGLLPEDAKIPYQEFLKDRLAIRAMVDADCEIYNIPMDL